jgi:ubiquinol-cytochrome c reductase cytochrome b subunit
VIRRGVGFLDSRLGAAPLLKRTLDYVFPDHWSFMLGEIALYSFMVLIGTGVYLTLFFQPDLGHTVYTGSYAPLRGTDMTHAYASTLHLSLDVKAGLLIRQTHHWAANVFAAAIVLHVMRIFFTGAFRKPRDINAAIGVTMLMLTVIEAYAGYSLPDDLLSGMGLAIGYSVLVSVPVVGAWLAVLIWGSAFPGRDVFESRLYVAHILIFPVVIAALIAVHLLIVSRQKHSQFREAGRSERNDVGSPLWPSYALRSVSLLLFVSGVLFLLGGLVQINPVWLWGPYHPYAATNGAQPDWYLGWLIGALRLMPPLEVTIGGYTLFPNPFFGGALFPLVVFGVLYLWPAVERRLTGDHARHELLDRPRDNPNRSAAFASFCSWVAVVFLAGSADQVSVHFQIPYTWQVWIFRGAFFVVPIVVFFIVRGICRELKATGEHPLRRWSGTVLRRTPRGGFERID